MKLRTIHNRVERHEYIFSRADVLAALQAHVKVRLPSPRPPGATTEAWDMDYDVDSETGILSDITLTQSFEYLSPAVEPVSESPGSPTGSPEAATGPDEPLPT